MIYENAETLRQKINVLIYRISELGRVPDNLMERYSTIEEHLIENNLSEKTMIKAMLLISDLSRLIYPETLTSIIRRHNALYRAFLLFYNVLLVLGVFIVVSLIIMFTVLFSPLESVIHNVDELQSTEVTAFLNQMHTWNDVLFICYYNELPESEKKRYSPRQGIGNSCPDNQKLKETFDSYEDNKSRTISAAYKLLSVLESYRNVEDILNRPHWPVGLFNLFFGHMVPHRGDRLDVDTLSLNPNMIGDSLKMFENVAPTLSSIRSISEQIRVILGSFVLPLLYGLLGAIVYVMRSTLSMPTGIINPIEHSLELFLRSGLGSVAGLSIGWFNKPEGMGELAATPFVGGFSIDILFSILGRFVELFSGPSSNARPERERRE